MQKNIRIFIIGSNSNAKTTIGLADAGLEIADPFAALTIAFLLLFALEFKKINDDKT